MRRSNLKVIGTMALGGWLLGSFSVPAYADSTKSLTRQLKVLSKQLSSTDRRTTSLEGAVKVLIAKFDTQGPGATGAQGPVGPAGVRGEKGDAGRDGRDGVNGRDGAPGIDGKDGIDGINGINGTNGIDGAAGINGTNGLDGKDGPGFDPKHCFVKKVFSSNFYDRYSYFPDGVLCGESNDDDRFILINTGLTIANFDNASNQYVGDAEAILQEQSAVFTQALQPVGIRLTAKMLPGFNRDGVDANDNSFSMKIAAQITCCPVVNLE